MIVPLKEGHRGKGHTESNPDGDEGQTDLAIVPRVVFAEDDRIAEEECILEGSH